MQSGGTKVKCAQPRMGLNRCIPFCCSTPFGVVCPPFQLPGFHPGLFKFNHFVVSGSFPMSAAKGSVSPRHDTATFARGLLYSVAVQNYAALGVKNSPKCQSTPDGSCIKHSLPQSYSCTGVSLTSLYLVIRSNAKSSFQ